MADNLQKEAASGYFMTRILEGTAFAGTGTKQELVELEKNLRQLLQLRMYPYSYIEKYLVSAGYHYNQIRNVFLKITGIKPEDCVADDRNVMMVPGCIPQINMGWGESKAKDQDYLFIMPWQVGYAVFGQKGDLDRTEIKRFDVLEDARAFVEKKVKEYHQFDKALDIKLNDPKVDGFSSFGEPKFSTLSDQGRAVYDYVKYVGTSTPTKKNAQYIKDAYFNGLITKGDFEVLAAKFITAEAEVVTDTQPSKDLDKAMEGLESELATQPLQEEAQEGSPEAFLANQTVDSPVNQVSGMMKSVEKYLGEKIKVIKPEYSLTLKSLKYLAAPRIPTAEPNISTSTSSPDEVLQSTGVVAVILNFSAKKMSSSSGGKLGMMVFSMRDGQLHTQGVFKGVDGKIYAMGKDGLEKYFSDVDSGEELDITKNLF